MWVCYANYNNIETTLKLEATRAPYLDRLLEDPRVEIDRKDKDGWTALHWGFLERAGPPVRHAD